METDSRIFNFGKIGRKSDPVVSMRQPLPNRLNLPNRRITTVTDTVRVGIDLGFAGRRTLSSLLVVASCQLQLLIGGEDTVLVSPFANDPTGLRPGYRCGKAKHA